MKDKEEFVGFAEHEYSPIVREKSIEFLRELIKKHRPKNILEIGTFIGYSASVMLEADKDCFVTTIEINEENAKDATKNLTNLGFEGRFVVLNCDAYEFLQNHQEEQFDFIFLDGPKGQYFKYLPYLKKMLKKGGFLLADDVLFYGLVKAEGHVEHKHRTIVNNLRKFLSDIQNDSDFETTIYDFANGMSLSRKK